MLVKDEDADVWLRYGPPTFQLNPLGLVLVILYQLFGNVDSWCNLDVGR